MGKECKGGTSALPVTQTQTGVAVWAQRDQGPGFKSPLCHRLPGALGQAS